MKFKLFHAVLTIMLWPEMETTLVPWRKTSPSAAMCNSIIDFFCDCVCAVWLESARTNPGAVIYEIINAKKPAEKIKRATIKKYARRAFVCKRFWKNALDLLNIFTDYNISRVYYVNEEFMLIEKSNNKKLLKKIEKFFIVTLIKLL